MECNTAMTMAMAKQLALVAAAILLASACHARDLSAILVGDGLPAEPLIHMLRPLVRSGGQLIDGDKGMPCDSWRVGVEAHNVRDWKVVPKECKHYVKHYMRGKSYRKDSMVVVDQAIEYANGLKLSGNNTEVWVFDISETALSNLPYYAMHGFGAEPFNATAFREWAMSGTAPPLPETLRLYQRLLILGIKAVFLTGSREPLRTATRTNLIEAGFLAWEKLILKPEDWKGSSQEFKSGERKKLEEAEYVIVGNIGDQWSDIQGPSPGKRTFKLPNPMYYVG